MAEKKTKEKLKESEIHFKIGLDKENVPELIEWEADDGDGKEKKNCKAFIMSIWSDVDSHALRLDLWTKEMRVDEMNVMYFETLMTMADSYEKATGDGNIAVGLRMFAREFGKRTDILKNEEQQSDEGNIENKDAGQDNAIEE